MEAFPKLQESDLRVMPAIGCEGLAAKSWPHILNFDFANNNDAEVCSGLAVNLDYFNPCRKRCQAAITFSKSLAIETSYRPCLSAQSPIPLISHALINVLGPAVVVMFM